MQLKLPPLTADGGLGPPQISISHGTFSLSLKALLHIAVLNARKRTYNAMK